DAVADLEESGAREEARVAPETRIDRFRRFAAQEVVRREVPHDLAVGAADLRLVPGGDETAGGKVLVLAIGPWQRLRHRRIGRPRRLARLRMRLARERESERKHRQ